MIPAVKPNLRNHLAASIREYLAANGRKGGRSKSAAKSAAARENGKRGGRPKSR